MRVEGYADQILDKLKFTTTIESDIVIFSGDVFHLKAPTRTSHALVQRMCDIIRAYDRPVYVVPGNHDVQHDRMESLEKQPLGVLFKAGAIPLDYEVDGVFGVPWLSDWRRELPLYMKPWRNSKATLMVAHAPIVQHGVNKPYEVIDAHDWAQQMGRGGHVAFGHMHDPDGVFGEFDEAQEWLFVNEGALSRGSLNEAALSRKPAVTLYDSEGDEPGTIFRRIEVPHLLAEKVFRVAEKSADTEREDRLEAFLDSIGTTTLEAVSVEGVISDLRSKGLRREVLAEIEDIFEEVTTSD
jgi:DNA repair exonuclease SbcCD nuclease subunit